MPKSSINIDSLIEALTIFKKYLDTESYNFSYPTVCMHDLLCIAVDSSKVSEEDKKRLAELSFIQDENTETFKSYHFGSA